MNRNFSKKTKLGRFKFGSVLFSTTLSLFILGLFGVIFIQAKTLTSLIRENIEIQIFLHKNISNSEKAKIETLLSTMDFVLKKQKVLMFCKQFEKN